ncbi:MAG TPA: hypothetical protein VHI10_12595, partial [Mycobacterium sp.]|nr:hypothetical protein [Mycobacterium sp.]
AVMKGDVPLEDPTFWNEDRSVQRMRACHVMAWAAGLAALILVVPMRHHASPGVLAVSLALLIPNAALVAVAVAATAWNPATARGGRSADGLTGPLLTLRGVSLALLGVSVIWVVVADVNYPQAPTHLPGLRPAIYVILGIQVILLIVLLVCIAACRGSESSSSKEYGPSLGGFTAWLVALIAWLLGGGFSIGIGLLTTQILGTPVISTRLANQVIDCRTETSVNVTACSELQRLVQGGEAPLIVPPPFLGAAVAIAVLILVAIVVALFVWRRVTGTIAQGLLKKVADDYPGDSGDDKRAKQVAKSLAWASLTDSAPRIVAVLAPLAVAEMAGLTVWYLFDSGDYLENAA